MHHLFYPSLFLHATLFLPKKMNRGPRLESAGAATQIHFHITGIRDAAASQKSIFTALFIYHQSGARLNTIAETVASCQPGQFHHYGGWVDEKLIIGGIRSEVHQRSAVMSWAAAETSNGWSADGVFLTATERPFESGWRDGRPLGHAADFILISRSGKTSLYLFSLYVKVAFSYQVTDVWL